jgi:hypothetical protein
MMKGNELRNRWRSARAAALALVAIAGGGGAAGCLDRPLEPVQPRTTTTIVERLTQSSVDKIDLLLAIDNSRSMADKQQVLADAVPDLVEGLVNPRCINAETEEPGTKLGGPLEDCPPGEEREFEPVLDIHIGIITSSLGGHGSDSCPNSDTCTGGTNLSNNDQGHLIARSDACSGGDVSGTWNNLPFLAWDPTGEKKDPPGQNDQAALINSLREMVLGAGQIGCGFEAQFESIYRFLADPNPYESISVVDGQATPEGEDAVVLQQRRDFMRSNSLLAVIMLTDENDCSVREYGQYYFATQLSSGSGQFHLPRARAVCEENPNDACCKSCGQPDGECGPDPTCDENQGVLTSLEDAINLRCWEQKRRFGIDFLYPVERYINMFTRVSINPDDDRLEGSPSVPNPIYSNLQNDGASVRDPGLVFFAGIIGVPWQLIAEDPADLTKGFKTSDAMPWDQILGNPAENVKPSDPHMVESIDPRPPLTVAANDPLNGHEWTIEDRDDLQYACVFDLPTSVDCSDPANNAGCDCEEVGNDNPLCGGDGTTQLKAKGYPGLRQLQVLKGIGSQGIVASVCPAQLDNDTALDYGYRPSIRAIIDRLKTALGGQCLPRTLTPDPDTGLVPCLILEATISNTGCPGCSAPAGRTDVLEEHRPAVDAAMADPIYESVDKSTLCFCEVAQLTPDTGLEECQQNEAESGTVHGWCYIDATTNPPTGNEALVDDCPDTERRIIRFVGDAEAQAGATQFITCAGEQAGTP